MSYEEVIKIDGYTVGERLLEGVMFDVDVELHDDETVDVKSVTVQRRYKDYFSKLNQQEWLDAIRDLCEDFDYCIEQITEAWFEDRQPGPETDAYAKYRWVELCGFLPCLDPGSWE